jgi:uncharacterized alkaline shock family protein YloU
LKESLIKKSTIYKIAYLTALKVPGVVNVRDSVLGKFLSEMNIDFWFPYITITDKEITIKLNIVVKYGCDIASVCDRVQNEVRKMIENMTGLSVSNIDITVVDVAE